MRVFAAVAAALASLCLAAAAQSQPAPATPPEAMALYPPAALAAGVDGWVVIGCGMDAHYKPINCKADLEEPRGQGFSEAALALIKLTPANPNLTVPPLAAGLGLEFLFCAYPASITPNPLEPRHSDGYPDIDRRPSDADIARAYPPNALAKGLSGRVFMNCEVALDGSLSACRTVIEMPSGQGFGAAALALAPDFHARPGRIDDTPVAGKVVQTVVLFGAHPPLPPPPMLAPASMRCDIRSGRASPRWVMGPTAEEMALVYPYFARLGRVGGTARVRCTLTATGTAADCAVLGEDPPGRGFGKAALKLTPLLAAAPDPASAGKTVIIPFRFVPPP